jgi:hypothetical protein
VRTTGISRHELPAPVPVMLDLALLAPGKLMPGEFCMMFMRRRSHHCPDRNHGDMVPLGARSPSVQKDIGYAKEVLGWLVLTDDGLQRIAIDREHPDFC